MGQQTSLLLTVGDIVSDNKDDNERDRKRRSATSIRVSDEDFKVGLPFKWEFAEEKFVRARRLIWTPTAKIQVCLVFSTSLVFDTVELTEYTLTNSHPERLKTDHRPHNYEFLGLVVADKYLLRTQHPLPSFLLPQSAPCDNTSETFHMFFSVLHPSPSRPLYRRNNNTSDLLLIRPWLASTTVL